MRVLRRYRIREYFVWFEGAKVGRVFNRLDVRFLFWKKMKTKSGWVVGSFMVRNVGGILVFGNFLGLGFVW